MSDKIRDRPAKVKFSLITLGVFLLFYLADRGDGQTVETWWPESGSHNDAVLLIKPIHWDRCVERDGTERNFPRDLRREARLDAGIVVHPHPLAIKMENWSSAVGHGEKPVEFQRSFSVSVVPYLQLLNRRLYLVPHIDSDSGKIDFYQPTCAGDVLSLDFLTFPAHYPTIMITVVTKNQSTAQRRATELHSILADHHATQNTATPDTMTMQTTVAPEALPERMDAMLIAILSVKKIAFFDQTIYARFPPRIVVIPKGFGEEVPLTDGETDSTQVLDDKTLIEGRYFFAAPLRPTTAPAQEIAMILPDLIVTAVRDSGRSLSDGISLEGCEFIEARDDDRSVLFRCPTEETRSRRLEILNVIETTATPAAQLTLPADSFFARVRAETDRQYWQNQLSETGLVQNGMELTVPISVFGNRLRFRMRENADTACDPILRVQLREIIEFSRVSINSQCRLTTISWPRAWHQPIEVQGCAFHEIHSDAESFRKNLDSLKCYYSHDEASQPIRLTWEGQWETIVVLPQDKTRDDAGISVADRFRCSLPFSRDDPWLNGRAWTRTHNLDTCSTEPHFKIVEAAYKHGDIEASFDFPPEDDLLRSGLLSLLDARWKDDSPLPNQVTLRLRQHDGREVARFQDQATITLNLEEDADFDTLKDGFSSQLERLLPLAAEKDPRISYGNHLTIQLSPDLETCQNQPRGDLAANVFYYLSEELSRLRVSICSYGRLHDAMRGTPVSGCVQATLTPSDRSATFNFVPTSYEGKRRLLVIALSHEFDAFGGRRIQDSLLRVFKEFRTAKPTVPFTLVSIQPGRRLDIRLQSEDLIHLAETSDTGAGDSLRARISELRFTAHDLRSLEDLDLVSKEFNYEQLEGVLYLTAGTDVQGAIPSSTLGTPLDWRNNGIPLSILTLGDCSAWIDRAKVAKCTELRRPAEVATKVEEFLRK